MPGPWSLQVGYSSAADIADPTHRWRFFRNIGKKLEESRQDPDFPEVYRHGLACLASLETATYDALQIKMVLREAESCFADGVKDVWDPSDLLQCYHLWMLTAFANQSFARFVDGLEPALRVFDRLLHSRAMPEVHKSMAGRLAYREEKEVVLEWGLLLRSLEDVRFCALYEACESARDLGWLFHPRYGSTLNERLPELHRAALRHDEAIQAVRRVTSKFVQNYLDQAFLEDTAKYTVFWHFSTLFESLDQIHTGKRPLTASEQADMADGIIDGEPLDATPAPPFLEACALISRVRNHAKRLAPDDPKMPRDRLNAGIFGLAPRPFKHTDVTIISALKR
eukprot:TRINITY_DN7361_c0_g1_i1.p1 TRINITY_DN7361_c0_g1~~TRINITY_DN7361_c0_g1_i1.p1  ORF type:complete len:349 (-),score=126.53 TRINITY_DN7361_c0_g1_i1:66-1082(-)